jgi:hypothetical protein
MNTLPFCSLEPLSKGYEVLLEFVNLIPKVRQPISQIKYFLIVAASTSWIMTRILVYSSKLLVKDLAGWLGLLEAGTVLGVDMGSYLLFWQTQ